MPIARETKKKTKPIDVPPEPEVMNVSATGTDGKDVLFGTRGDDTLSGGSGSDILLGRRTLGQGDGDDQLFGGTGDDTLYGGPGRDLYDGGDGSDTVAMDPDTVGLVLPTRFGAKVDLSVTGAQNTRYGSDTFTSIENLIGTGKADRLKGNAADNSFWGEAGQDRLWGRDGDDRLSGGEGNDRLFGDAGADTLAGGTGNDRLTGGAGNDVFEFALKAKNRIGIDRITDFAEGEDKIALVDPTLGGLKENGMLASKAFRAGSKAEDLDDRVIYDAQTGMLSYDADGSGSGAAVTIARIAKGLTITHEDFIL
jgi:Ca2+-binding RTX toxin-like protein